MQMYWKFQEVCIASLKTIKNIFFMVMQWNKVIRI